MFNEKEAGVLTSSVSFAVLKENQLILVRLKY